MTLKWKCGYLVINQGLVTLGFRFSLQGFYQEQTVLMKNYIAIVWSDNNKQFFNLICNYKRKLADPPESHINLLQLVYECK